MGVKQIQSKEEFLKVKEGGKLVVVDFFATWCGPCKAIAPAIETLSQTHEDVEFVKVDVDELEDVAQEENISAMPTFRFYKSGKQVGEVVGANLEKIKELIQIQSSQ